MTLIYETIIQLFTFLKFHFTRIRKWSAILFKKNKKLKKISLDYYKNWHSESSFLLVNLEFTNAIYFKVGNFKSFDFSKPLILNLKNLNTSTIKVEVYGFFQNQIFLIELKKEIQINSQVFQTRFIDLSSVELPRQKTKLQITNYCFSKDKPKIRTQNFSINSKNIRINFSKFKIQEYI